MIELSTHPSIGEISEPVWDGLLSDDSPPYLRWKFLQAFEATGCVDADCGWAPCHISLRQDGKLVLLAPAYVKGNSEGEFVFDHSWARFAYERLDVAYYPKLIVAVPFTPATGPRLLLAPGANRPELYQAFARVIGQLSQELSLSSAHVLFPNTEQAEQLAATGLLQRYGLQYHWHNPGYADFEDFLSRFSSKRRNQIKRERRELDKQGLEIRKVSGSDWTPEWVDHAYRFYLSTVNKYFFGRQYLNRAFFEEVCARLPNSMLLIVACKKGTPQPVAGAFNLVSSRAMYGRYWGANEAYGYLHFNVCYYAGIEHCIERDIRLFEPGAGGEHKLARGFEPTITHSFHCLHDSRLRRAIADFVVRERHAIEQHIKNEEPLLKPL